MHNLPSGTVLGSLVLDLVIEYYDFPRLFTCHANTGQPYVALSVYDDDDEFHWLYLAVSSIRNSALLRGQLSLHDAFRHPEGGYLTKVVTHQDGRSPSTIHLLPEQVTEEDLPAKDYVVSVEMPNNLPPERPTARQIAFATRRETFDYRIFPGQNQVHEIPARKLGGLLTVTQELIDALGQASSGLTTVRGPLPAELLHKTKLHVTQTFPGSFGVQFCSAEFSDLFDHSIVSKALRELANLIEAQDSEDLLSNKLHSLHGRVTSKYRRLLKELVDLNSGLFLDWGAVNPDQGGVFELSSEQVKAAYTIVDRMEVEMADEITISGKLIGFNSRTRRYEILSSEDGMSYAGKLADEVKLEVANPAIGQFYEVDLRMLIETQSTSGDELIRWILVRLGKTRTSG
jgi:hypothetical protein